MAATIRRPWKLRVPPVSARAWLLRSSVVTATLCSLLLLPIWYLAFGRHVTPKGLPVRLLRPGIEGQRLPNLEPLLVQVRFGGRRAPPLLYVNSQRMAWDQLGPLLDKELLRRPPDWPVYIQGDRDLEWQQVVRAIDVIRGKRAKVVLLTAPDREPAPAPRSRRP